MFFQFFFFFLKHVSQLYVSSGWPIEDGWRKTRKLNILKVETATTKSWNRIRLFVTCTNIVHFSFANMHHEYNGNAYSLGLLDYFGS